MPKFSSTVCKKYENHIKIIEVLLKLYAITFEHISFILIISTSYLIMLTFQVYQLNH